MAAEVRCRGRLDASAAFAVPATLQASLMARLDRIAAAKEVAQVAAVFGRDFTHAQVQAVAGLSEPALLHGLQQLVVAGLAVSRSSGAETSYSFKHALIRDTAYGMLLRGRRRELHARAAATLAAQSPLLAERQPELLAHHFTQAGLAEPAMNHWTHAARRALARSALTEAIGHLRQALDLLPALPEGRVRQARELELQSMLGGTLFAVQTWSEAAIEAYTRAQALAEQLGEIEAIVRVNATLVTYQLGRCRYDEAGILAERLLGIAVREDSDDLRMIAHRSLGACRHWTGRFAEGQDHCDRALQFYDPPRHRQLATMVASTSPATLPCLGVGHAHPRLSGTSPGAVRSRVSILLRR